MEPLIDPRTGSPPEPKTSPPPSDSGLDATPDSSNPSRSPSPDNDKRSTAHARDHEDGDDLPASETLTDPGNAEVKSAKSDERPQPSHKSDERPQTSHKSDERPPAAHQAAENPSLAENVKPAPAPSAFWADQEKQSPASSSAEGPPAQEDPGVQTLIQKTQQITVRADSTHHPDPLNPQNFPKMLGAGPEEDHYPMEEEEQDPLKPSYLRAARPFDTMERPSTPENYWESLPAQIRYDNELEDYNRLVREHHQAEEARLQRIEEHLQRLERQPDEDKKEALRLRFAQEEALQEANRQRLKVPRDNVTLAHHLKGNPGLAHEPSPQRDQKAGVPRGPTRQQRELESRGVQLLTVQPPVEAEERPPPGRPARPSTSANANPYHLAYEDHFQNLDLEEANRKAQSRRNYFGSMLLQKDWTSPAEGALASFGFDVSRANEYLRWRGRDECDARQWNVKAIGTRLATFAKDRADKIKTGSSALAGIQTRTSCQVWSDLSPLKRHPPFAQRELGRQVGNGLTNPAQTLGLAYLGIFDLEDELHLPAAAVIARSETTPDQHFAAINDALSKCSHPPEVIQYLKHVFVVTGIGLDRLATAIGARLTYGRMGSDELLQTLRKTCPTGQPSIPIVYERVEKEDQYWAPWDSFFRQYANPLSLEKGQYASPGNDWYGLVLSLVAQEVANFVASRVALSMRRKRGAAGGNAGPQAKRTSSTTRASPLQNPSRARPPPSNRGGGSFRGRGAASRGR